MRPTYSVPPDNGSCQSLRCPPSNPLMASPSHPAQASARTAHPSGPSMHVASMGRVSPLLHQPGSMTYSPPTTTTMGGGIWSDGCTTDAVGPSKSTRPLGKRVDSTLTCYHRGGNAIAELGPSFLADSVFSHPPSTNDGGSAASTASHALVRSQQHVAFTMSTCPGFADANPWVMEEIKAVARELQCWYQRHSICWYLARQTWQRLATTTTKCWKRRIWLNCWFAQQALQRQKRLRLQLLCCGALAYAVSVWGDCRPPPTPTDKTSDPKVLRHPFRDRGLLLPQRRRARQNNRPCRRPG
jgi:hypothetical protein